MIDTEEDGAVEEGYRGLHKVVRMAPQRRRRWFLSFILLHPSAC